MKATIYATFRDSPDGIVTADPAKDLENFFSHGTVAGHASAMSLEQYTSTADSMGYRLHSIVRVAAGLLVAFVRK